MHKLVYKIAFSQFRKTGCRADLEDMVQDGYVGLLNANQIRDVDKYPDEYKYMSIRIKGEIIDSLRRNSGKSRKLMSDTKLINKAQKAVDSGICKTKAEYLGFSDTEYFKFELGTIKGGWVIESDLKKASPGEDEVLYLQQIKKAINMVYNQLTDKQKFVIKERYVNGISGAKVAREIGCSESGVSNMNARAVKGIQRRLKVLNYI